MLWLALATLITVDPAALSASAQTGSIGPVAPMSAQTATIAPAAAPARRPVMGAPIISTTVPAEACSTGVQRIELRNPSPTSPATDGRVRMYRLLALNDARGCPIPVIARDVIPEADRAIRLEIH